MNRLRRVLCDPLPRHGWTELPEAEGHHLGRVLRVADGEEVEILDGRGSSVFGTVKRRGKTIGVEDCRPGRLEPPPSRRIIAESAVLKSAAMDWLIEKYTELGVDTVVPLWTDYGVVKEKAKGKDAWQERWQAIADQALKQCGRLHRLTVAPPVTVADLLVESSSASRLLLDPRGQRAIKSCGLKPEMRMTLGPEGGFTELEARLLEPTLEQRVTLGIHTLRAETAGICAASYLLLA